MQLIPLAPGFVCHHGVSVAGTIAANPNNNEGVAGVGYNTKVALYNVGTPECLTVSNIRDGVLAAIDDGYKIINVSAVTTGLTEAEAINYTNSGGVIVVAGSSNNHSAIFDVPGVINTGRVMWNFDLNGWTYYDYGPNGTDGIPDAGIDIFGQPDIMRLVGYDECSQSSGGTSIVAPMVAGVVALMRSANPSLTPAEIECIIRMTGRSQVIDSPTMQVPADANPLLLDAEAAVAAAINYDPESIKGENVHLTGTQTINNIATSGDLIIDTGADITLTGMVCMGYNSNIIVNRGARLHINGATVQPMECLSSWRGFRVVGNSFRPQPNENATLDPDDSGVLIINNDAQINNARKAISMNNTHILWDNSSNYYGGLVVAENSDFNFNQRSFEFMRYNLQDNSRIISCTFTQNEKHIMTMWRTEGLLVQNNVFTEYDKTAIFSLNAEYEVSNNNIFNGLNNTFNEHYGIQVYNTTMPDRVPTVDGNIFNGNGYGVILEGIVSTTDHPNGIEITDNRFWDETFGIHIQGTNDYFITENSFDVQEVGVSCRNSGTGRKDVFGNRMSGGTLGISGITVVTENSGLRFYENCFEDLGMTFNGDNFGGGVEMFSYDDVLPTVFMEQRNATNNAADNCFTNCIDDISQDPDTDLPNDHFVYVVEPTFPQADCRVPDIQNFIDIAHAGSDGFRACIETPTFTNPSGGGSSNCTVPTSELGLENSIAQIESEILNLLPVDPTNLSDRKELYDLLECLKRLKMELIRNFVQNDKEGLVEPRFKDDHDPYVRTYAISHLINTENYTEATSFLNAVQDTDPDWLNFRDAQLINIRRLSDFENFSSTPQENDFLFNAGNRETFYATWIRSIYTAVTGNTIIFDLPRSSSFPRNDRKSSSLDEQKVNIFPNPASDDIRISGLNVNSQYNVKVCNISGAVVKEVNNIKDGYTLDISTLNDGIYILQIFTDLGEMIQSSKVVKIN